MRFSFTLTKLGYNQGKANHNVFFFFLKFGKQRKWFIQIAYVDDIVITCVDIHEINKLKGELKNEFDIKDLGKFKYFFRMEVVKCKNGIFYFLTKMHSRFARRD